MFWPFKRKKWRHVKTFKDGGTFNGEKVWLYIQCFESECGKRKYEHKFSHRAIDEDAITRTVIYQTKIYRWMNGRYDPDIPSYHDVPEEDTANALRGEIK